MDHGKGVRLEGVVGGTRAQLRLCRGGSRALPSPCIPALALLRGAPSSHVVWLEDVALVPTFQMACAGRH